MIQIPDLWVPGRVADAIIDEAEGTREAHRAVVFNRRLRAIDSRLECWLQKTTDPENDLRAGFYYIRRHNEDGTIAVWEVHDKGAFREPADDILEAFRRGDANRTNLAHERYQQRQADARRREKRLQDQRDERVGRVKEEIDFAFRLQVPVKKGLAA